MVRPPPTPPRISRPSIAFAGLGTDSKLDASSPTPWVPRGRYDPSRFEAHYTFGEWRYYADLVRDKDYAMKKVAALGTAGFADPLKTRNIRIKLLLYNNGLPMLCSMSIEASLSVTGVMRTQVTTYSFAVQVRRADRAATLGCTAP